MKLKLFSIMVIVALGIVAIGMLGGCGGNSSNKEKVLVESISVDLDLNWIEDMNTGIQLNPFWSGEGSPFANIYGGIYSWDCYDSTDNILFGYWITHSEDPSLVILEIFQDKPFKVKFNITPSNATNKGLKFTVHKVNLYSDSSYDGWAGGWAGAVGDEITNWNDYATITQDGVITIKSGFPKDDIIRITATTTDGSDKSFSFDIGKFF